MALLVVFLLGMVAFSVDIGWIVLTQSELRNAADSAALAGVKSLMDGYVQYNLPGLSRRRKAPSLLRLKTMPSPRPNSLPGTTPPAESAI